MILILFGRFDCFVPVPKTLILRTLRSSRLEGRTALLQQFSITFTRSKAGTRMQRGIALLALDPAFAG